MTRRPSRKRPAVPGWLHDRGIVATRELLQYLNGADRTADRVQRAARTIAMIVDVLKTQKGCGR